ncbi:MAG: hypothetical protein LBI55_01190 [Oscillospiraceae bacterium]|jgi:hypothetical protein|nr:hypothetical protein [Oscillospiraceae bacterium]
MSEDVFKSLGADGETLRELEEYTANRFQKADDIPEKIEEEPFIESWRDIISQAKNVGVKKALNDNMSHGEEDIILKNPDNVKIEIYNSFAGPIPIIYILDVLDFEEIVTKLVHKGKRPVGIERTGAAFVYGNNNRFIILSNKPYSNIPAEKLQLDADKWKSLSLIIRREHECTHYFTNRFLNNSSNNMHDEIVADFAGIFSADGNYHAYWFLAGMGLDKYPQVQSEGRFPVYTKNLSDETKEILKKMTVKIANNLEKWSNKQEVRKMSLRDKILFLCGNSLVDLYELI